MTWLIESRRFTDSFSRTGQASDAMNLKSKTVLDRIELLAQAIRRAPNLAASTPTRVSYMLRQIIVLCCIVPLVATGLLPVPQCQGDDTILVHEGIAQAVLVMASDADGSAGRLRYLLLQHTGATLPILAPSDPIASDKTEIVLCTAASRGEMRDRLPARLLEMQLKPEGFILEADPGNDRRIDLVGGDAAGLRYAVGELWNYHLALAGKSATVERPLSLVDAPAFSKRIFWNWDFLTNWDNDLRKVHETLSIDPGAKQYAYQTAPDAYNVHFERVVDFAADHKLNGLIIWGFCADAHGGIPAAQRLSRYAKDRSVRVLPGVGTVIYSGFYHGGDSPYYLPAWLRTRPDVRRMIGKDGKPIDAPCPSDPNLYRWLEDGARWFFTTFPDIGGVNLEHGDFFECHCPECKAQRAKPENDPNFYWDMMVSQVPVVNAAHKINPDLWMTYSPYDGYRKEMMSAPPRFLKQFPPDAITQWTYTGMVATENGWPDDLKPPPGAKHSIGLLHQGSFWDGPKQWWGSPGQTYALVPEIIQKACARAIKDESEGLEIVGQIGIASPQNELNYLAFEEFTWHPQQTMEGWIANRLPPLYGGVEKARRFIAIVSDATTDSDAIAQGQKEAEATASALTDPRQARRWSNLAMELSRRLDLAKLRRTKPFGPGPIPELQDLVVPK